jgi:hypothetical protein
MNALERLARSVLRGCFILQVCALSIQAGAQNADLVPCPKEQTKIEVEKFRGQLIDQVLSGNMGTTSDSLTKCYGTEVPACLGQVKDYANLKSVFHSEPGHEGTIIYQSSGPAEGLTVSSSLGLPPEFQLKSPKGEPYPNWVQMPQNILALGKKKGWKVLPYRTRSSGGFDSGGDLLLVVIPGKDKDIFIQTSPVSAHGNSEFNDPQPKPIHGNLSEGQSTMTVITIDKTKNPPVGQLHLLQNGDGNAYPWNNDLEIKNCVSCHAAPLRTISPLGYQTTSGYGYETRMSSKDEALVDEINKMMSPDYLSWGHTVMNGKVIPVGPIPTSPPLGWAPEGDDSTRSEEFIKSCAMGTPSYYHEGRGGYQYMIRMNNPPVLNYKKIAKAMNCVKCHDGSRQGYLAASYATHNVGFKLLVDRSMPPEDGLEEGLNNDERLALYNCLYMQRNKYLSSGVWAKNGEWMKRQGCLNPVPEAPKTKSTPKKTTHKSTEGAQ